MSTSRVISAAGTQIAVSATLPATHDITGFEALSFTDIAEIVDGGSNGRNYNEVTHSPLGRREILRTKGSYDEGTQDLSLGRDLLDAGQAILRDASESDNAYSFRITFQNGDIDYLTARVMSFITEIGSVDTIVSATASVSLDGPKLSLFITGVLTASVNAGGTFTTVTDGTFPATQASTSGSGTGAEFSVTLVAGAVTAALVTKTGSGYDVADTINLLVTGGPVETVPAVLDVDTIVVAL